MRVILADCEADVTAGTALENQHRTRDGFGLLPEQQPIARPIGIDELLPENRTVTEATI